MTGALLKELLQTMYQVSSLQKQKISFFIDSLERIATFGKLKNDEQLAKLLNEILSQYKTTFERKSLSLSLNLRGLEKKLAEEKENEENKNSNN